MSCAFCHVQMHPLHPPDDPEKPEWGNLSSNIGNQYFKVSQIFGAELKPESFVYQLLNSTPRGTLDTSLISTDSINNPNAMNPLFNVGARLSEAVPEKVTGGALYLPPRDETRNVPHILMDGADSIGLYGALDRVYINIGSYSQHWLQQHNALIGLIPQKPFSVKTAQENSVYWNATQNKVGNIAKFFTNLKSFRLEDAPGGKDFMTKDPAQLDRGKVVSRTMIWEHLYDEQDENTSNVVDVYIRYLRNKVDKGFDPPLIVTRWGEGYMLRGEDES